MFHKVTYALPRAQPWYGNRQIGHLAGKVNAKRRRHSPHALILRRRSSSIGPGYGYSIPDTCVNQGGTPRNDRERPFQATNVIAEPLEGYRPGGYHPVHLGDLHGGRYKIVHKLGFGHSSTVWLARDKQQPRDVALKIYRADVLHGKEEANTLGQLAIGPMIHIGKKRIVDALHQFAFEGPNGRHSALVTEVAGPRVRRDLPQSKRIFPVEDALRIAGQLVEAVAYMHTRNVVHGDICMENILYANSGLTARDPGPDPERLRTCRVKTLDDSPPTEHVPHYPVEPLGLWDQMKGSDIKLIGFGKHTENEHVISPKHKAPETLFNSRLGREADIWSLGCTIGELVIRGGLYDADADDVLGEWIKIFGDLPAEWQECTLVRDHDREFI